MNKLILTVCLILIVLWLGSCSKTEHEPQADNVAGNDYFSQNTKMATLDVRNIYYQSERVIDVMDIRRDGSMVFTSMGESGARFTGNLKNGEERIKPTDLFIGFIKYFTDEESIITYNAELEQLELRDYDMELQRVLVEDFHSFEIKDIILKGNKAYILNVKDNPYEEEFHDIESDEGDGYVDYGERMYCLDLKTGEMTDTGITNVITLCDSSDSYFYLYTHQGEHYQISVYEPDKDKIVHTVQMDEAGYLFSVAVVGDRLYFTSMNFEGICSMDMTTKEIRTEVGDVTTYRQCDFDVIDDSLIFLDRQSMSVITLCTSNGSLSSGRKTAGIENEESDVVIGYMDAYNIPFSIAELESKSGMKIGSYSSPKLSDSGFYEKMLIKLMAGDRDVDVFILGTSGSYGAKLCQDGVCLPLDSSDVISTDNSKYFDYISEFFKTSSGKIWGIPLLTDIYVLAGFPENINSAGMGEESLTDFSSMLSAIDVNNITEGIFIPGDYYGYELLCNYTSNNKPVDYDTDLFRRYMNSMWDGWTMYGDYGYENHPLLGKAYKYADKSETGDQHIAAVENRLLVDRNTTLFNMVSESDMLNYPDIFNEAEVIPMPLLSDSYKQIVHVNLVAVINPYGKNKDKAIKLLESLAELIRENGTNGLIYKDITNYGQGFDTESEVFRGLYQIRENAIVAESGIVGDIYTNEIPAYQRGEIDLDTAIKSVQRKEDAYRNE